jgi:CubicO group peptidase (beta-lactamase class C family)
MDPERRALRPVLATACAIGLAGLLSASPFMAHRARAAGLADPSELEAFLDGFLAGAMRQQRVPGLVFVMVKDGAVFLAKGYGLADREAGRPVDPERTLFRLGSVSKLYTATAVMQLVEQGKLDLHRDVNGYLREPQLPERFSKPVTAAHLLTHTGGFDDRFFGMAARRREDLRPLGEYLAARMPDRVLAPGEVASYSNHGLALAGLLVEAVSGHPFEEYVRERVFEPLGMTRSVFSLPAELEGELAQGYFSEDGELRPAPYDYLEMLAPAGSLMSTGIDQARFMLAHLQDGLLGEARILGAETARRMHSRQFTHDPRLPGIGYGFIEDLVNGRRLIGHGGNWRGFTSRMVLDPEADLGFFLSYNALSFDGGENRLHFDFVEAFYDRYFPEEASSLPGPPPDFSSRAGRFTGSYRHNRYIRDSFGKLAALFGEWRVSATPEGTLTVRPPGSLLAPFHLVEVEPLVFLRDDGGGYVVFGEDESGRITHMFAHLFGPGAWDKLSFLETTRFQLPFVGALLLLLLSGLLGWPLAYFLRGRGLGHPPRARLARWLAAAAAAVVLFAVVRIAVALGEDPFELTYGVPFRVRVELGLLWVSTGLSLALVPFAAFAWTRAWWTLAARIHYSAVAAAALALIPLFAYWRLLDWSY